MSFTDRGASRPAQDFSLPMRRLAEAILLVLVAINLRPVLSSLAPVLPEVMRDTGLSATGASILAASPVLCLGAFGALAPLLVRRIGAERMVVLVMISIAAGCALRGWGTVGGIAAGALLAGVGIGVGNVVVPTLIKRDFADRAAPMTASYTMAICLGGALGSGSVAPLMMAFHDAWPEALAAWAIPALAVLVFAALLWRRNLAEPFARTTLHGPRGQRLWREPLAWQVTFFMGLQSVIAYAMFSWLATILRGRGDSAAAAGLVVSVSLLAQAAGALIVPPIAMRRRSQSAIASGVMFATAAGMLLLIYGPLAAQWVIAVLLGLAMGGAFSTAIMLIVLRSPDAATAADLSGMAQGFGYTLAAAGPFLVGTLRDITGDWSGAAALFSIASAAAAIAGWLAGRPIRLPARPR